MIVAALSQDRPQSSLEAVQKDILDWLKQHPDVPFSVGLIADVFKQTPQQVEALLETIEGPQERFGDDPGAYVHIARCSNQVVYLP